MKVKLEDDGEDNSELIEEIEDSFIEEYIPLPGQYEINESRIIDLANAQDIWEDKILPLTAGKRYARHFVQLAVGSYMLLYLGVISCENMQIEGFWYYLFLSVFEAATIHYAVAKIFGPLFFNPACSLR